MELVLPNNYVELEQEEMMYLDGGRRYSGAQGWAVVAALGAVGGFCAGFSKLYKGNLGGILSAVIAGGPIAWLGGFLAGFGVVAIGYAASCFLGATSTASWYMTNRGYFDLNKQWVWSNPISIS